MGLGKKPEGQTREARRSSPSFRREFVLFLILFFVLWLLSFLLTRRYPGFVNALQLLVAREVAWSLEQLGYRFVREGWIFTFYAAHGGERLIVIPECTGLYATIIYCSIIGAYPARAVEKLAGVLIGVPLIHLLNLLRMVFISLVLYHRRDLFGLFHGYLWQVGFVVVMLLMVVVWMDRVSRGSGEARRGGSGA